MASTRYSRGRIWNGEKSFKLSNQQRDILLLLMQSKQVSLESFSECLWPHPDDMPDAWKEVIRVVVRQLKKKLLALDADYTITCKYGRGYSLEELGKEDVLPRLLPPATKRVNQLNNFAIPALPNR